MSKSLIVSNEKESRRIDLRTILHITTVDYISTFYLSNNKKFICTKPLNTFVNILPDHFFQISRSRIVNLNEIVSIKRGSRLVVLNDSTELKVSVRRTKLFNEALAGNNITLTR